MSRVQKCLVAASLALIVAGAAIAQDLKPIALPAPQMQGGKPIMQAFALRATGREFAGRDLSRQTLSNLLWAAFGINRPKEKMRTAPSAIDWQETDLYVVIKSGTYVYDALTNTLKPVVGGDLRAMTGTQDFVKDAPVALVYVADMSRVVVPQDWPKPMIDATEEVKDHLVWADTMAIAENVYLFAASEGLVTGIRALVDRPPLAEALMLRDSQLITMAQSVGYPKK